VTAGPARGVRAIIGYKTLKAVVQLGLALLMCALWPLGLPDKVSELALSLRTHATHGWAIRLSDLLSGSSSARRIEFTIVALSLDGALTALEAWALHRGKWWGPWLVVVASGALLPFEVYEFWRFPRFSRAFVFAFNLAIVIYLWRRAARERTSSAR
jgi:uncharacterized membrane protein (DUF2068 family)